MEDVGRWRGNNAVCPTASLGSLNASSCLLNFNGIFLSVICSLRQSGVLTCFREQLSYQHLASKFYSCPHSALCVLPHFSYFFLGGVHCVWLTECKLAIVVLLTNLVYSSLQMWGHCGCYSDMSPRSCENTIAVFLCYLVYL